MNAGKRNFFVSLSVTRLGDLGYFVLSIVDSLAKNLEPLELFAEIG